MKKIIFLVTAFLFSLENCIAQLPVANFIISNPITCPGVCVSFSNLSLNATSYQWIFNSGMIATGTDTSEDVPCVFFSSLLNHDTTIQVVLIATNSSGSDTMVQDLVIHPYPFIPNLTHHGDTIFAVPGLYEYSWYLNNDTIPYDTNYYTVCIQDGYHFLVVTDTNGCINSLASFDLPPLVDFSVSDSEICEFSCIDFLNLSQQTDNYQWIFTGGIPSTSLATNPSGICYLSPGNYSAKLIGVNGILSHTDSMMMTVLSCVGMEEIIPMEFHVQVEYKSIEKALAITLNRKAEANFRIFDLGGKLIFSASFSGNQYSINEEMTPGIYFLLLNTTQNQWIEKFIVR